MSLLPMNEARNDISPEMALSHLQWLEAMGADEAVGEAPRDYLAEAPPSPSPQAEKASLKPNLVRQPLNAPAKTPPSAMTPLADRSADAEAAIAAARTSAASCQDLAALTQALMQFEACPLSRTASKLAFLDGAEHPEILIIGDTPAREDDREGLAFAGPEGRLLDRMLQAIGHDRQTCLLSNLVFWHPPGRRLPTEAELAMCEPYLSRLIELAKPKAILGLGNLVVQRFIEPNGGIKKLRGQWAQVQNIPLLCTWHPRELLQTSAFKADAWKDLQILKAKLNV